MRARPDAEARAVRPRAVRRRVASVAFILVMVGCAQAQQLQSLEAVRRIAATGAIDVALDRIEANQPRNAADPEWGDWEILRFALLLRRGRNGDLLRRYEQIQRIALPDRTAAQSRFLAARAALNLQQFEAARAHYLRYFLIAEYGSSQYREARLAVIDSLVGTRDADDAYRAMLRFQQDFVPLRGDEAEHFASALIELQRFQDAATWLTQLDKNSPAAMLLRLRAGLIKPDAAIAQARAALAKGGGHSARTLLLAAGIAQNSMAIQIEARELRLNLSDGSTPLPQSAASLWDQYDEFGAQSANQLQLLRGDDRAWLARAETLSPAQPQLARSLWAHVAAHARNDEARIRALERIVSTLQDDKLPLTALHLFTFSDRHPIATLGERVRFQLGTLAAANKRAADAVRYWQGLASPAGLGPEEWRLRYAIVLFQASMPDQALEAARSLLAQYPTLAPESLARLLDLAVEALDTAQVKPAQGLLTLLLTRVQGANRTAALMALGRACELLGEHRQAAEAFLEAAIGSATPEAERGAIRARESAAANLARAGLEDDARAVYRWLATNVKDSATRERALQALKRY
jgi:hypothetical protein